MPKGYVVLVLHAHLPYVLSHGKWPHGSDWLCEAVCETYIPLLNMLGEQSKRGIRAGLTIGITPILCEMLAAPLFKTTLKSYIAEKIDAAAHDRRVFMSEAGKEQAELARGWEELYRSRLNDFTGLYREDLVGAFRRLQDEGRIEMIVSAATHAYLPLLGLDASIRAQVAQGVETYRKHFYTEPHGMWLPECAYCPQRDLDIGRGTGRRGGLESFLATQGLDYFFVDPCRLVNREEPDARQTPTAGIPSLQYLESPRGDVGDAFGLYHDPELPPANKQTDLYAVHRTGRPETGECSFFARDVETSYQVWSGRWGYPGDPFYLEFHKKHDPGGLRYWRVTDREGDLGMKLPYEPDKARAKALVHADHFRKVVEERLGRYREETGRTGVLTLLFDAELFGHWWFEGIEWLSALVSGFADTPSQNDGENVSASGGAVVSAFEENYAKIERASVVLQNVVPSGTVSLPEGSWGEGGLHLTWHNKETEWTWKCIHDAERSMSRAVAEGTDETGRRILRQMARELFLLQSSDWQFLITTGTAADYGKSRFSGHFRAFEDLRNMFTSYRETGSLTDNEKNALRMLEEQDAVFDNVNPEWFEERIEDGL